MENSFSKERRGLLFMGGAMGLAVLLPNAILAKETGKEDVGPAEDLMREHGGLNRILLIYEEGLRRIETPSVDLDVIKKSASIIRNFIENYHEKLEEEYIFPRMKKVGKLVDLVTVLEAQHEAGRKLTVNIEKLSVQSTLKNESDKAKLVSSLRSFVRMYRPHESREDTVLFPAFHEMLSKKEYEELGEKFEDREHKLFGKEGFEGVVQQISELERVYGIYDLSKFTPP